MADSPVESLRKRYTEARVGGGEDRVARQHAAGKLTARERVETFCDPGSFQELDALVVHRAHDFGMDKQRIPGDGVVTGHGRVAGRPVFLFAQDFKISRRAGYFYFS